MMKKIFLLFITVVCCIAANAQKDDDAARLKMIEQLPSFEIHTVPDSTLFNSGQLRKNEPVVIMFFSPDCDHCQKETKELVANKEELKNLQIVMITPLDYKLIKAFYQDYKIASAPNIIMGQDIKYALGLKYKPKRFPAIYVYNSKGELAKAFEGNAGVPAIIKASNE